MVSNQVLGARAAAGLLTLCVALSGCAHHRAHDSTPAAAKAASSEGAAASASPAPEQATATEAAPGTAPATASNGTDGNASADTGGNSSAGGESGGAANPVANPEAPMHYTVKKGDTLWGIASMYLKDPWLWPEVWVINPQVPNPHLIYPGDKLALAYGTGGRMEVRLEQAGLTRLDPRLRSDPLQNAIPTIPYSAIAAFLSRPTLMSEDEIRHAPYVLAFRDMHQVAGNEIEVYIKNLSAAENSRYAVVHISNQLRDPDDGKLLGYEGIYTGTALVKRAGQPAKAVMIDTARETLAGDRLVSSDNQVPVTFTPSVPTSQIHGNIISVVVRDLWAGGRSMSNSMNGFNTSFAPSVRLPDERAGTLLVFKVYDRMSYGLIVGASNIIHNGAPVHNP